MFLVFLGTITLFTKIIMMILLFLMIFLGGLLYLESKESKELIEEFMLLYGMNKLKNEKKTKEPR